MRTLLERQDDVIRLGDTIEIVSLMAVMSSSQLINFISQLAMTSQTTLFEMAISELKRRRNEA